MIEWGETEFALLLLELAETSELDAEQKLCWLFGESHVKGSSKKLKNEGFEWVGGAKSLGFMCCYISFFPLIEATCLSPQSASSGSEKSFNLPRMDGRAAGAGDDLHSELSEYISGWDGRRMHR